MISLWVQAYGYYKWDEKLWSGRRKLRGPVKLKCPLVPTLASFTDPLDPTTVRIIQPHQFEQVFGPGVRLRRVALEMISAESSGVPVTQGIEQRLPWLDHLDRYRRDPTNPFTNTLPSYIQALRRQK